MMKKKQMSKNKNHLWDFLQVLTKCRDLTINKKRSSMGQSQKLKYRPNKI